MKDGTRTTRRLWVMLDKNPNGIPFRFVRLTPRIFGIEIVAVWRDRDAL